MTNMMGNVFLVEKAWKVVRSFVASVIVASVSLFSYNVFAQTWVLADGVTRVAVEPVGVKHFPVLGAFEGGYSGTIYDARINSLITKAQSEARENSVKYDIPTGAPASILEFNGVVVRPFTQKLLRFEEFGTARLPAEEDVVQGMSLPRPLSAEGFPNGHALDTFLKQEIAPYPRKFSNTEDLNPWQVDIENFLGRPLNTPPAEGRPPGELWSHQRYEEFYPQNWFQTVQTGARVNSGLRDDRQRHNYALGEFGLGGLYHNTAGRPGFDATTAGVEVRLHPGLPVQEEKSLWTFDGTFPPKLLSVRYGEPVLFRHYNALPLSPSANNGFGLHTLSTHEHNGHNPSESDGYTSAFFFPGQFYDYRWPIQLAGYDSINVNAADPRASFPCEDGETLEVLSEIKNCEAGRIQIPGDYRETMSTHWFHDHMLDYTAQNVYKGNVAMMNYYSALDRGNEVLDDGVNLRFPSGSGLSWGNRDYDLNFVISAKAWDTRGQLFFNVFNTDGFLGDRMTVNWLFKPTTDVRARKYRLRLLNGSVSRYLKLAMVTESGDRVPFHMVLNDGNIMEHSVHFPRGILPIQSIAERYDIIVDFSAYAPGTKIYMVNLAEHRGGRGPEKRAVPLRDVLSGAYSPQILNGSWVNGDPAVGKFLEFMVVAMEEGQVDVSMNPSDYEAGGKRMIEMPTFSEAELANATHRDFEFGRSNGSDETPWTIKVDGGSGNNMDPRRLSTAVNNSGITERSGVEIWHLKTGGGWSHPIHIHFEEGKILDKDGRKPPPWEAFARKDVYRLGGEDGSARKMSVALRFREFAGTYMEHCHNTQHEDTAMMSRWDIENPGQTILMPTPIPSWDGVTYVDSYAPVTLELEPGQCHRHRPHPPRPHPPPHHHHHHHHHHR